MEHFINALDLFNKGGLVMYPLLACSVIAVAVGIERFLYLRAAKTDVDGLLSRVEHNLKNGDWAAAHKESANANGAAALMLAQVLSRPAQGRQRLEQMFEAAAARAISRLRRRIVYLETIVTLAPLLGLLGTVNGMIHSFSVFNVASGRHLAITGGVGEALIATAAGLCVAIVALIFHSYLNHGIENIISEMEETANAAISAVMERETP